MTTILADRNTYAIRPRFMRKKGGKPLNGFALDITIRFNTDGVPFLEDHNGVRNTMPFANLDDLRVFIDSELVRNHKERFGSA